MTPTTVVNKHHGVPSDVYIGRGSIWGNPYVIGRDGDREEVIAKYERYLDRSPRLLARLHELRGKILGCFCAPRACHGHVLARRADALEQEEGTMIRVGTDGGCHPNPGGPGGWAWVAEDGRYGAGSFVSGTNNIAELMALRAALSAFPDEPLTIEYDSEYAAKSVTLWGKKWRRNGETHRSNYDLIMEIMDIIDARSAPVVWEHVRGHDPNNAHPLNTHADEIATRMRKIGRNTEESGVIEIDWNAKPVPRGKPSRSAPKPKRRSDEWGNLTAVGEVIGLTAREVGVSLRGLGLYQGGSPTDAAVSKGLVKKARSSRFNADFYLWHVQKTAQAVARSASS